MTKWKCPKCDSRSGLQIYPRVRAKILLMMHSDTIEMIDFNRDIVFELADKAVCVKCSYQATVQEFLVEEQAFKAVLPKIM